MKERTLHKRKQRSEEGREYSLLLFNDDINTFDHVIKSLVEVCGHDPVQAEQCALIVHLKGNCEIKKGMKEVMQAMSSSLNAKGLDARVLSA